MGNFEKIIQRKDGSEARILVLDFRSPFNDREFKVCVFKRNSQSEDWKRVFDTPERKKQAESMSVEEYKEKGRNPIFYVVSIAEILHAITLWRNNQQTSTSFIVS